PGARGDCLKIGRVIAAFVDHFARRTKNARSCFGRVGTHRTAASPACRPWHYVTHRANAKTFASSRSTSHRTQTSQKVFGHPGISGQLHGPAIRLRGLSDP